MASLQQSLRKLKKLRPDSVISNGFIQSKGAVKITGNEWSGIIEGVIHP